MKIWAIFFFLQDTLRAEEPKSDDPKDDACSLE